MNKIFFAVLASLVNITTAYAEPKEVWHGWMNLTPCSKVEWNNNGLFGTPSPTVRTGPQELHGYLTVDLPNDQSVVSLVKNCADKGVAAAGVAAVLTNWSAAWPTFEVTFKQCLHNAPQDILSKAVNFRTNTTCSY